MSSDRTKILKIKKHTFAIIAVVVFYTLYENTGTHYIHGKYQKIIETSTSAINTLAEIDDSLSDIDNAIVNLVNETVMSSDASLLTKEIDENITDCKAEIEEYEKIKVSDDQKQLFDTFKGQFDDYLNSLNNVQKAIKVNDFTAAKTAYSSIDTNAELTIEKLMDNTVKSQEHDLSNIKKHIAMNNIMMYIIAAVIILVLLGIDRRRAKMTQDLIDSQRKVEKQKGKIAAAVFTDVLTDVNNRLSFVNKFSTGNEKVFLGFTEYFIMFNIDNFSSVNSKYGVSSGDLVLNSTAERLKEVFPTSDIYRTGSDEFVVVMTMSDDAGGYKKVSALIEKARMSLANPHKVNNGSLKVKYTVSVARKTGPGSVDSSVLAPLTESIKQSRENQSGAVMLTDLN